MRRLPKPVKAFWCKRWLVSCRQAAVPIVVVGLPVILWWLQPWKLFIRTASDDRLPPGARITCRGEFVGHIHRTSGVACLIMLDDGSRILRLENLHATLGPRLRIWLSDVPLADGGVLWRKFALCRRIDVGPLRANRGNADYAVPHDADTEAVRSVILWCERFRVSFGGAQLHPLIA